MGTFGNNPSEYEGKLIEETILLKKIIKELLVIINRNGIELYNEVEVEELLIKAGL